MSTAVSTCEFFNFIRKGPGFVGYMHPESEFEAQWVESNEQAAELLEKLSKDHNVYVSMGTFPKGSRRKQNACISVGCFWLDIDAHAGSKYQSSLQIIEELRRFCEFAGLPKPNVIHDSGHGLHIYWVPNEDISIEEWLKTATLLQKAAQDFGLGADPITTDSARVLRAPNSINFRDSNHPRPTAVIHFNPVKIDHAKFSKALASAQTLPKKEKSNAPVEQAMDCTPANIEYLWKLLNFIDPDPYPAEGGNRANWMRVIFALLSLGWGELAIKIAHQWSQTGDLYDPEELDRIIRSYDPDRDPEQKITFATIVYMARQNGCMSVSPIFTDTTHAQAQPLLRTKLASAIDPQPIVWLVENSIPMGEIVVIAGQPGIGKSQAAIGIASAVTNTAKMLPDGSTSGSTGTVLILANEDDAERTIIPRLDAAEANKHDVHLIEGVARESDQPDWFQLDKDIGHLESKIKELGNVKVVIIDPPSAYLGAKTDSYKESDVRRVLAPLARIAQRHDILILLVVHLNKRTEGSAQHRIGGSTAWTAVPRAAFMAIQDPLTRQRFLLPVKNNLGDDQLGFEYQILEKLLNYESGVIKAPYVHWLGISKRSVESLLAPPKQTSVLEQARHFLEEQLQSGPKEVTALLEEAEEQGISKSSLERAKKSLAIESQKTHKIWVWQKPELGDHDVQMV
jgi:putative DNA primase/helicase